MASTTNLGNNVLLFFGLPQNYAGYGNNTQTKAAHNLLEKQLKESDFKYQMAITANCFQQDTGHTLKRHGFKDQCSFYSYHGKNENLTFWYKINKKYKDNYIEPFDYDLWNCSVSYDRNIIRHLTIVIQKLQEKNEDLIKLGYKNIDKTPIWFKINDEKIIEVDYYKKLKKIKKIKEKNIELTLEDFVAKKY